MSLAAAPARKREKAASRNWRADFYRQCRAWHAYLSAFAFIALIFFSVTGLLLNHPEWIETARPAPEERTLALPADALQGADAAALADAVQRAARIDGAYSSGEIFDSEAMLRFEGPRGASDVSVDLASGRAEISTRRAGLAAFFNDLHRGKNAGAVWRAVIDATALLLLALSIVGYALFFSLRFRLATSLILTAASLAALAVVIWAFVP